jgi:hypothetical protein
VGLERGLLSHVSTIEELLGSKSCCFGLETENTAPAPEIRYADHVAPFIHKNFGTNFTDKRLSLGRYSSLTNSGHGVLVSFR